MVCVLPKDGVCFPFTGGETKSKVNAAIFEGSRVFVNAFQKLTARVKHGSPYCLL
jgi:hypothetical protein